VVCGLVRSPLLPINPQRCSAHADRLEIYHEVRIIGSGNIGSALARTFARKNIEVAIANSRGPETLASLTKKLGPNVHPESIQDAYKAEMIFLAVPFPAHRDVAKQFKQWNGKIVVDAMNTLDLSPKEREELGGVLSSEVVAKAFSGARLVKGFNHLPAEQLGTNPSIQGQRQAVFLSSNDVDASATVAAVATQLGFAPIELGKLDEGGTPLHVVAGQPRGLTSPHIL